MAKASARAKDDEHRHRAKHGILPRRTPIQVHRKDQQRQPEAPSVQYRRPTDPPCAVPARDLSPPPHQPHQSLRGRIFAGIHRPDVNRAETVDRTAEDGISDELIRRDRLAVSIASSTAVSPLSTTPSAGIVSPVNTRRISPTAIASAATISSARSRSSVCPAPAQSASARAAAREVITPQEFAEHHDPRHFLRQHFWPTRLAIAIPISSNREVTVFSLADNTCPLSQSASRKSTASPSPDPATIPPREVQIAACERKQPTPVSAASCTLFK